MGEHEHDHGHQDEPRAGQPEAPSGPQGGRAATAGELEPERAGQAALAGALKYSFAVLRIVMVVLVIVYLVGGVFSVPVQEVRFKVRFGRVVPEDHPVLSSGTWHIKFPWEELVTLSTTEKTLELPDAFWTMWPLDPIALKDKRSLDVRSDGYLITGDVNIVHARLRVRYAVSSSVPATLAYAFAVKAPEEILKRDLMAATVKVVGSMPVMQVLQRQDLFEQITDELRKRVRRFEQEHGVPLGVDVIAVEATEVEKIKNPTEPIPVRDAFNKAQMAASLYNQAVQDGIQQANAILADAEAGSREITSQARADKVRLVAAAAADAEAMKKLMPIYEHSPQEARTLRDTFYLRALEEAMANSSASFVLYERPNRELRLMLGRALPKPGSAKLYGKDPGAPR